jgi:glutamyl aminopeptidase
LIEYLGFGNYVTCKWWDDLWLNEAMATWLSYKPFTANYPDWNLVKDELIFFLYFVVLQDLQFLTEDVIPVMWDDAKPSSHPIIVENVTSAADITSLFDSITYSKGASILRMLEKFAGADKFRNALQEYLRINAFDVGDPSVFYNQLFTTISGEDFMKNWLKEMNYPLLNVNLTVENGETKIVFTQSRFIISDALNSSYLDKNYRWKINIQCVLGGNYPDSDTENVGGDIIEFLLDKEQEIRVLPGKTYAWIKCNQNLQGFYVTDYSFQWQHFSFVLEAQPTVSLTLQNKNDYLL